MTLSVAQKCSFTCPQWVKGTKLQDTSDIMYFLSVGPDNSNASIHQENMFPTRLGLLCPQPLIEVSVYLPAFCFTDPCQQKMFIIIYEIGSRNKNLCNSQLEPKPPSKDFSLMCIQFDQQLFFMQSVQSWSLVDDVPSFRYLSYNVTVDW